MLREVLDSTPRRSRLVAAEVLTPQIRTPGFLACPFSGIAARYVAQSFLI